MRVVVTGVSGLVGRSLAASLRADGHEVIGVSRQPGPDTVVWDPAAGTIGDNPLDTAGLEDCDAVVHLAGETIEGRWSASKKRRLVDSRVQSTELLARTVARLDAKPRVFVCASAMGFYGDQGDSWLHEGSAGGSSFLAGLCVAWEGAAHGVEASGVRLALARTSMVLDPSGGALPRMALITRLCAGGRLGSGRQYWSWITLHDEVRALRHLIDSEFEGPVNLAAPNPAPQLQFAKTLARVLRRPAVLPAPGFAIRLVLGQMGQELLLDSTRLEPRALLESGFEFGHVALEPALRWLYSCQDDHDRHP
ncbi:MAG: TIGR01777 family oxidoreductase [Actinomycetota bacterium]|jgi:uncharacterized protein|nr:TIGR01777 family oxidoreductase [Actinomycetota bacterium]